MASIGPDPLTAGADHPEIVQCHHRGDLTAGENRQEIGAQAREVMDVHHVRSHLVQDALEGPVHLGHGVEEKKVPRVSKGVVDGVDPDPVVFVVPAGVLLVVLVAYPTHHLDLVILAHLVDQRLDMQLGAAHAFR